METGRDEPESIISHETNENGVEEESETENTREIAPENANIDPIQNNEENHTVERQCCKSLGKVFRRCLPLILFGLYQYDIISDVLVSRSYLARRHPWWGALGLTFVVLAWLVQCSLAYNKAVTRGKYASKNVRYMYYGRLSDRRVAAPLFLVLPLIQISWSTYEAVIGKVNRWVLERRVSAARVKYGEVLLESFPQLTLQLYVICKDIKDQQDVTTLQWISLSTSLASLSLGLANGYMFQTFKIEQTNLSPGASWYPYKITWLILGIFTIGCRIYICAVWGALLGPAMLLVPLLTGTFIAIGIWGLRAYFPCRYWARAGLRFGDRNGIFAEKTNIVLGWIGTLLGNGFSGSGMVLSLVFLTLSVIPLVIKSHYLLTLIGIVIATVVTVANVITMVTYKGQKIAQRWVDGDYIVCKAGQQHFFNGERRGALDGEKFYYFRYY